MYEEFGRLNFTFFLINSRVYYISQCFSSFSRPNVHVTTTHLYANTFATNIRNLMVWIGISWSGYGYGYAVRCNASLDKLILACFSVIYIYGVTC